MLALLSDVSRLLGRYEGIQSPPPQPRLRRENRIKTVHGSVGIEGNTLSIDQVTAILDGKRVAGDHREILEVRNTLRAYDNASEWDPFSRKDFLAAHGELLRDILPDAGRYRMGNVGIITQGRVRHVAPQARRVPALMADLFDFLKTDKSTPLLIKSCAFHYELEFIHPFSDGNGRIGRLWQHVILLRESPAFAYVPVESIIRQRQKAYYQALAAADRAGDSTAFIEFSLATLRDALREFVDNLRGVSPTPDDRIAQAIAHFGSRTFSRKDYLCLFKTLSPATASRDLLHAVATGRLSKSGDKALTRYRA